MEMGDPYAESMLTAAVEYLDPSDYPPLLEKAIALLQTAEYPMARDFIEGAYLRQGRSVRGHLKELFLADHFFKHIYRYMAWRDGGVEQVSFLAGFLDDPERRERAIGALLELRLPEAFALIPSETEELFFHLVGFTRDAGAIRPLYSNDVFHLQFAKNYATNTHETWQQVKKRPYRFGGQLDSQFCATCGDTLHHLLTFPVAEFLPDTSSLPSLTLATCNHCLGTQIPILFLSHDESGIPRSQLTKQAKTPEFLNAPFEETGVALTAVSERYRWQEWICGPNLNRLGGHPAWIERPEYPSCPNCGQTMRFLLQLDSELPLRQATPDQSSYMMWGSGGVAYFFWCDTCRISAGRWQCT